MKSNVFDKEAFSQNKHQCFSKILLQSIKKGRRGKYKKKRLGGRGSNFQSLGLVRYFKIRAQLIFFLLKELIYLR
jgi:hypothetical protein